MKLSRLLLLLCLLPLVLAACQVKTEFDANGSGRIVKEVYAGDRDCGPPDQGFRLLYRTPDQWCVYSMPFGTLQELSDRYYELGIVNSVYHLEQEGDKLLYDIVLAAPTGYTWKVRMPGRVLSHNAPECEGAYLVWKVEEGQPVRAQAVSQMPR